MIEDEKYFMGRDILNQCYSYNQLYYFYRELGLKGIDRYINELQNESKSKSREIERLNNIINGLEEYIVIKLKEFNTPEEYYTLKQIDDIHYRLQELKGDDSNE